MNNNNKTMKFILYIFVALITLTQAEAQKVGPILGGGGSTTYAPSFTCGSFKPVPGRKYILSAWIKEIHAAPQKIYQASQIKVAFQVAGTSTPVEFKFKTSGAIIEEWQRIIGAFTVPANATNIAITFEQDPTSVMASGVVYEAYMDDIRIHPFNGNLKSFVYDANTQRLMAELDENNFATFYKYDSEGGLILVQKETERGIYTIQETRSYNTKVENVDITD